MKFPGSKLLHNCDLSAQHLSLDDLLRSCQQIGLTGFAEVKTPSAVAMIFYYLGGEVNALYREGPMAYNGALALGDHGRADLREDRGPHPARGDASSRATSGRAATRSRPRCAAMKSACGRRSSRS